MPESFSGGEIASAMSAASAVADPVASPAADPSTAAAGVLPASDPASTSQAVTDAVSSTTDPTQTTVEKPKGPIPFDAHKTALDNARTKATQETEAKFGWAAKIPEQHRATVGEFYQTLDTEPVMAIEALISTAANDPDQAPKLRSLLGRLLGNRAPVERPTEGRQPVKAGALPAADFQDEQGNTFYSAKKMSEFADALEARIDAKYANELRPLKTDLQTRSQRELQAKQQRDADQWAETRYAKISQWPHFKAHEKAILAAMDAGEEVGDAYIQIVVPQLSQTERTSVVADLHAKANASSINPGNPASAVNGHPKDFAEAFAQLPAGSL